MFEVGEILQQFNGNNIRYLLITEKRGARYHTWNPLLRHIVTEETLDDYGWVSATKSMCEHLPTDE